MFNCAYLHRALSEDPRLDFARHKVAKRFPRWIQKVKPKAPKIQRALTT
jgi:hypothetical protein